MTYAPGKDRAPSGTGRPSAAFVPGSGAGGVFAGYIQGATPKYAINEGLRSDQYRNTLARIFMRVDSSEMDLFLASISDEHTKAQLAPRLAGDPSTQQADRITSDGTITSNVTRTERTVGTNGYLDFFLQQASMPLQEKFDVKETLADNYNVEFFGQQPPVWSYSGWLMNTVQDDQAQNFLRLYLQVLRGTQLARRGKIISLKLDSLIVTGAMVNLNLTLGAASEIYIPFSFSLLVKRIQFVNFTRRWVPTRADTAFAADPNAVPYDGRPRSEGSIREMVGRMPADLVEEGPTPARTSDPRTRQTAPATDALTPPPVPDPTENEDLGTALGALASSAALRFAPIAAPLAGAAVVGALGVVAADALLPDRHILASIDPSHPLDSAARLVSRPETQNPPRPAAPIPPLPTPPRTP